MTKSVLLSGNIGELKTVVSRFYFDLQSKS